MLETDVLVIGGGPAGAACATTLAMNGISVALVESGRFDSFRIGEALHASARGILSFLGLTLESQPWSRRCPRILAAWGQAAPTTRPPIFDPHRSGWIVDRRLLDRALFEGAGRAGARLWENARVENHGRINGSWQFSIPAAGGPAVHGLARFVVEATGRKGRSTFAPGHSRIWFDRLIGLSLRINIDDRKRDGLEAPAVEAVADGWWYSVTLNNDDLLLVFYTDADLLPPSHPQRVAFLRDRLRQSHLTKERLAALDDEFQVAVFDARSSLRRVAAKDGWAVAGDGLLACDPLTGKGLCEALGSGIGIGHWIEDGLRTDSDGFPGWVDALRVRVNRYLIELADVYSQEQRWTTSEFWRRRHELAKTRAAALAR